MADALDLLIARGPQQIDFSGITNLPESFSKGQQMGADYRTRQSLRGGLPRTADGQIDFAAAADMIAKAGNTQGALDIAKTAASASNSAFDRGIKTQELDLRRRSLERQETPQQLQVLKAAGLDPASPEGRKALFPRTDTPVSAADKKAINTAEDELPVIQGTIEALDRALELNDKTYKGFGAEFFGNLGTKAAGSLGMRPTPEAQATSEWSKLMSSEALQTMSQTLKGATTDFELRKFTEMLADPSTDPKVRASVIQRMRTLAQRKLELSQARVKDLRGGDYYKPGYSPGQQQRGGAQNDPLAAARDAISRGADPNAVRQRLQQNGIDASGL